MTIYKNSGNILKAQEGTKVLPSIRDLINDSMNRKIKARHTAISSDPVKAVSIDNTKVKPVKPPLSLTMTPAQKRMEASRQNALALKNSRTQAIRDRVQDNMVEVYKSPLMSPGYFTPEGALIGAMQGAVKMGPDIYNKDYAAVAGDALMMLPLAPAAGKAIAPAVQKIAKGFKPAESVQATVSASIVPEVADIAKEIPRFNLSRSPRTARAPNPKAYLDDLDIGNGLTERTPNPLSKKNAGLVKEVRVSNNPAHNIQLKTTSTQDGRPAFYFSANMPESQLQAGRAFKQLEKYIPKGSLILENKSLSNDSFYNMIKKAAKTKDFQWSDEGFVPLNNSAKNNLFLNHDKIIPGGSNVRFEDFNEAKKALAELNAKITQPGIPKAKLSKVMEDFQPVIGGEIFKKTMFGIDVPNIGLTKLYKRGGILYQAGGVLSRAVLPANKVTRGGKNFDRTYLPTMTKFKDAPCVGDGCGKQVTNDTSKLTGVYDTSATFDPKIFGTNDHSGYGQWNVPTTYANKKGKDGKLLTRQIKLSSEQLMNSKKQSDSISQGDKVYFKRPSYMNLHKDKSNKLYGRSKTDQEIRHVALAVGKNDKGEVLYQHSMGKNGLQRETMAGLQDRGYVPKAAYRTTATHQKLQSNNLGYDRKTKLNTSSNSDYVNKTKAIIYQTKEEIGTRNGLTRSLMDKLSTNVIPIGIQESNAGFKKVNKGRALVRAGGLSNYVDEMYDSRAVNGIVKPVAKTLSNIGSNVGSFLNKIKDGDFEKAFTQGSKKSAWELELKANELAKRNPSQYKEIYKRLKYDNDNQYVDIAPGKSSKGFGKIKDIPKVAADLGVTDYTLQGSDNRKRDVKIRSSAIASQAVLAENASRIKKRYPNLSEDSVVEMAITSYNSGLGTILNDKYVENYVVNKRVGVDGKPLESSYLRKILNLKKPAFTFKSKPE